MRRIQSASEMGFNRRKLEDQRRESAAKEAASRRATDAQVLDKPHSRAVLPTERTICRVGAPITDEYRRRNARGASAASAWGVERVWPAPLAVD
jgi:hypothetical protein